MRKIIFLTAAVFILTNCKENTISNKETVSNETTEKHVELYPNGKVKIQGDLVKGIRQGKWESFYENGVKWSESNYLFGKRNGLYKLFYPNGRVKVYGVYENDEKVDVWFFYRENGEFEKEINFNQTQTDESN